MSWGPSKISPLGYIIGRQYDDGVVIKNTMFRERLKKAKNLYRKDLLSHYGCVNAIEFSSEGELLVSGGDDRRVLLWSFPEMIFGKCAPVSMQTTHISNIFCVAFDSRNTKIFSGGNDDQVLIHDISTTNSISKLAHRKPVYGLHVNPQNDDVIATAGDDGRVLLFDVRESTSSDIQCLAKQKTGFHSVMFNPRNPRFVLTSNSEEGIALWDCRQPKEILVHYDSHAGKVSGISACFNASGDKVLALRRRLPPVMYATQSEEALCQFYHPQYYNSCTMKTCCFAGDEDEYILSGSDDFNLYMWKVPEEPEEWGTSHVVLKGHRSIVNQVRYNKHTNLIASSGVEKMIKLWSTLPFGTWKGSIHKEHNDTLRTVYSHEDYMHLVGHSDRISHDYSDQSTQEDMKMMAFFDSLIQREIEGWNSSSEESSLSSDCEQTFTCKLPEIFPNNFNYVEDGRKYKSNRIAHLIYQKRNRLAKMAHQKSQTSILKRQKRSFRKKTILQEAGLRAKHKACKSKSGPAEKKPHNHNKSSSSSKKEPPRQKYVTRQSLKHQVLVEQTSSSNSLDAPSTSTGITNSSSSVYRVIEQDSDEESTIVREEEPFENNFVNILPTPLNGTHDMFINVLEVSNQPSNSSTSNVVTLRNNEDFDDFSQCASTSNGTSSRGGQCSNCLGVCKDSQDASSSSSFFQTVCTTTNCIHACSNEEESDFEECDFRTPVKKRRLHSASDSGCATGPGSSSRSSRRHHQERSIFNEYSNSSDDEEYHYEKIKKRMKKARMNLRKRIGHDSDSN